MTRQAAAASDRGDIDTLRALLAERPEIATTGYPSDSPPSDEYHLLMHLVSWPAGRPNGTDAARLLLEHGADPNTRYNGTETALHWAASCATEGEIIDVLVAAGADVDAPGGVIRGGTPLMNAVHFGFTEVAARLVGHGAAIHNLPTAAGVGRIDLLEGWYDGEGRYSADSIRVHPGEPASDRHLGPAEIDGWTFLAVKAALMCSQFHVVDWFIDRGFDIDHIPDGEDWGCLHHAAYSGSLPMAMFLVSRGADLKVTSVEHQAGVAGFACVHGHPDVMNYLIDQGVEITPVDAAYAGRLDVIAADGGKHDEPACLLAATIGTTTHVGKPVAPAIAAGRRAIARYLLQRDPELVHEQVDGTALIDLATESGDEAMATILRAAAPSA